MKTNLKKISTFLFASIIGLSSFTAQAGDDSKTKDSSGTFEYSLYSVKDSKKFHLSLHNAINQNVTVQIRDHKGHLIFTDVMSKIKDASRKYDLSQFESGIYQVDIWSGNTHITRDVMVGIRLMPDVFNVHAAPIVVKDKIFYAYENANGKVVVSLKDENGAVLFKNIYNETQKEGSLDISHLHKGTYKLSITHQDRVLEQLYEVQ